MRMNSKCWSFKESHFIGFLTARLNFNSFPFYESRGEGVSKNHCDHCRFVFELVVFIVFIDVVLASMLVTLKSFELLHVQLML